MTLQEQQEFEGDNIATIAAQQMRIDELEAFIAAFEAWLAGELSQLIDKRGVQEWDEWMIVGQKKEVACISRKCRALKSEHLPQNKSEVE